MIGSRPLPGSLFTQAPISFDARLFPRKTRLVSFEEHVRGSPRKLKKRLSYRELGAGNENINIDRRMSAHHCYLTSLQSSGYTVTIEDVPALDARFDAVSVAWVISGNAEAMTLHDRFKLATGDMYLHATSNFETTFGETDVVRLVFPAGPLKELFRRSGEFVVVRDHDPVSKVLKASISGLENAVKQDPGSVKVMSSLAVQVASRVLEDHIHRSAISGHDIVRERAREYIHDNIASPNLGVSEIAAYVGASRATLYRTFESLGGIRHYITLVRVEMARSILGAGQPDRNGIAQVAFACGFSSSNQMIRAFKHHLGVSPTAFGSDTEISATMLGGGGETVNVNSRPIA